ncbi:hypothetical protein PIB30_012244 [Stylosanthes scabra]|uniref:Uncharacterized protein n=1 Tax=Stylosanthes scabra TaxID=79078 RepID=A0ABU6V4D5_9FABA|nr:hypothetical protein [Stylosanthes scabra]
MGKFRGSAQQKRRSTQPSSQLDLGESVFSFRNVGTLGNSLSFRKLESAFSFRRLPEASCSASLYGPSISVFVTCHKRASRPYGPTNTGSIQESKGPMGIVVGFFMPSVNTLTRTVRLA